MGSLFDKGPSRMEVKEADDRAYAQEQERLRASEQKLRQRESKETIQGDGIATTGNIELGSDLSTESTGTDAVTASANPAGQTDLTKPVASEEYASRLKAAGGLKFNFGNLNF